MVKLHFAFLIFKYLLTICILADNTQMADILKHNVPNSDDIFEEIKIHMKNYDAVLNKLDPSMRTIVETLLRISEYNRIKEARKRVQVENEIISMRKEKEDEKIAILKENEKEKNVLMQERNLLIRFAKNEICTQTLRHEMEIFKEVFLLRYTQAGTHLEWIFTKLKVFYDARLSKLHAVVSKLTEIARPYWKNEKIPDCINGLESISHELKNITFESAFVTNEDLLSETRTMKTALLQLQNCKNVDTMRTKFHNQKDFWKTVIPPRLSTEILDDLSTLSSQLPHETVMDVLVNVKNITVQEKYYIINIIQMGRIFGSTDNVKYRECVYVFYVSMDIGELKKSIYEHWNRLDESSRIDKYCYIFSTLYNRIINSFIHTPVDATCLLEYLPPDCLPNCEDYKRYLKLLARGLCEDDANFVGLSLVNC